MKQLPRLGLLVSFVFALGGCPIWNNGDGTQCLGQSCGSSTSNAQCTSDFDCPSYQYCGGDNQCHDYAQSTGVGGSGGGQTTSTTSSAGTGGAPPVYCGNPKDCASGETCAADG